jgi:hypothetical protein
MPHPRSRRSGSDWVSCRYSEGSRFGPETVVLPQWRVSPRSTTPGDETAHWKGKMMIEQDSPLPLRFA